MKKKYNPYEDPTLHTTKPEPYESVGEREGFNDIIKHFDTVQGFQNPKRMAHIPSRLQLFARWAIIVYVGGFFIFVIYQLIINAVK